jgi:hypothetical protein
MRRLYRLLSAAGTARTAVRGPAPLVRRVVRQKANLHFNRLLRRILKP